MTSTRPMDHCDAELVAQEARERKPQMQLDQKSILSAVGELLAEADAKRIALETTVAHLHDRVVALQARCEALERGPSRTGLRAVGE